MKPPCATIFEEGNPMKCRICQQDITLVPSAQERATKYGGRPSDYLALFTAHATCAIAERNQQTLELIRRSYPKCP